MRRRGKLKIYKNIKIEKIWYWWVWIHTLEDWKKLVIKWWVLPWSVVDCKVVKNKKDYKECQVTNILDYGNSAVCSANLCKHYMLNGENQINPSRWCWWCKWQLLDYEKQLELKDEIIYDSFRNIKDTVDKIWLKQIIPSPNLFWYRNKIEFSFWKYMVKDSDGSFAYNNQWQLWFNKQWDFSKVVDISDCKLITTNSNVIFSHLKALIKTSWLPVYDKKSHVWFFRHLVIRQWINTWMFLVNLVVSKKNLKEHDVEKWDNLLDSIVKNEFLRENVNSFLITNNDWLADIVKWQDITTTIVFWDWYIFEKLNYWTDISLNFRVSPFSFFQTNTKWAELLFKTSAETLWKVWWKVLDLYCWSGAIWMSLLKMWVCDTVLWVEIVEEAIVDARYNAKINWLENHTEYYSWKTEKEVYNEYLKKDVNNISAVVVDPPRDWMHKDVIKFLLSLKVMVDYKILYISCNPVTMSRDIQLLIEWWFKLLSLQWVDMFPHTHNIEMIWLLK